MVMHYRTVYLPCMPPTASGIQVPVMMGLKSSGSWSSQVNGRSPFGPKKLLETPGKFRAAFPAKKLKQKNSF